MISKGSAVGDPPVFDADVFPWAKRLEDGWREVRQEVDALMRFRDRLPAFKEISPDQARIARDRAWKSYFLFGFGRRQELACRRCPRTAALVESIPGLESAMFSVMEPGAVLVRHRGPTKAIITCHLGLIVPIERERCWIKIDKKRYVWEEGKTLIFDDTYPHKVRNETSELRVVLLLHVRRPTRGSATLVARGFLGAIKWSPYVRDARRRQDEFARAFELGANEA